MGSAREIRLFLIVTIAAALYGRFLRPIAGGAWGQVWGFGCDLFVRRQLKPPARLGRVGQDEHAARVGGKLVAAVRESRVSRVHFRSAQGSASERWNASVTSPVVVAGPTKGRRDSVTNTERPPVLADGRSCSGHAAGGTGVCPIQAPGTEGARVAESEPLVRTQPARTTCHLRRRRRCCSRP